LIWASFWRSRGRESQDKRAGNGTASTFAAAAHDPRRKAGTAGTALLSTSSRAEARVVPAGNLYPNARTKLGTTDREQGLAETFTAHHKPPAFINSARFPLWKTADQGPNQPPSPGQILLSPSHTGGQGTGQDTDLAPTFIRKTFFPLRMALSSKENSFSRMTDRLSLSPV